MLPAHDRLRTGSEITRTVRSGRRSGRRRLVVHLARRPVVDPATATVAQGRPGARAGLVVSGSVGGAVTRKAVSRRLRHVLAPVLASLPDDADVVVRALPAAAGATSAELDRDVRAALRSLTRA
ncbi:ribonuclease P protein component [Rhodococcus aerolatus]